MISVFCTPGSSCLMTMPGTQVICFSPRQTVAGTKGQRHPCPLLSHLSSGEQETLLWYMLVAKEGSSYMAWRRDQDKDTGSAHPELIPPSPAHRRQSRHPTLPDTLFVAVVALLLLRCEPLLADMHTVEGASQTGGGGWAQPRSQDQNSS